MAFVVVQHLPPQRESLMADILSKHTAMPVRQVEDGMAVEANHVYVIRPGNTMTVGHGLLHLGEPLEKRGHQRPVDDFFRSLAREQRERAVCVVLSGMGSNGTAGAQMVKAVGGVCVAQDPESAKFPSMPRSLIDAGLTDYVLRPAEMPEVLARYADHPYAKTGGRSVEATAGREPEAAGRGAGRAADADPARLQRVQAADAGPAGAAADGADHLSSAGRLRPPAPPDAGRGDGRWPTTC